MGKQVFAERVKTFRLAKEMDQERLAAFLGVSVRTVQRIEAGKGCRDLTRSRIEKRIADLSKVAA